MRAGLALLVAALPGLVAPSVAGQDHHEGGAGEHVLLLDDAGGNVTAGVPVRFTWVALGEDGTPTPHVDARFAAWLNGVELFATTPASGHDYDGVSGYTLTFPGPGVFLVEAEVVGPDGDVVASSRRTGNVSAAPVGSVAAILDVPERATAGAAVDVAVRLEDDAGSPVADTVVDLVVRRTDGFETLRTRTGSASGAHAFRYAFPSAGSYVVAATVSGASAGAAAATREVRVDPAPPAAALPSSPTRPLGENLVDVGEAAEGFTLVGTYDPFTAVGPHGRARLAALVLDAAGRPPPSPVEADVRLVDAAGTLVFEATGVKEADGLVEVAANAPQQGDHVLSVAARAGSWTGSVDLLWSVHPAGRVPMPVGPAFTSVTGLDGLAAGSPGDVVARVEDAAGAPLAHAEVDFDVVDAAGVAVLSGKLHTHDSGEFPARVGLFAPGRYAAALSPHTLAPTLTPLFFGGAVGTTPSFGFEVGDGPGVPAPPPTPPVVVAAEEEATPAPGVVLLVVASLAGASLRRR